MSVTIRWATRTTGYTNTLFRMPVRKIKTVLINGRPMEQVNDYDGQSSPLEVEAAMLFTCPEGGGRRDRLTLRQTWDFYKKHPEFLPEGVIIDG